MSDQVGAGMEGDTVEFTRCRVDGCEYRLNVEETGQVTLIEVELFLAEEASTNCQSAAPNSAPGFSAA